MYKQKPIVRSLALAFGGAVLAGMFAEPSLAQQTDQPVVQERVEITGSSLRRVDAETALPVTIIKAEDLVKQGVTTAEQAVQRIASSQSVVGVSQSIGATAGGKAEANLRGLGSNKTLVLLNGRRLANHAYIGLEGSVDLNAIPIAAIDRIEVLRDGASAIYGTDAVGGVINFILRREYTGFEAAVENQTPQKDGGKENRATLVGGFGSLDKQRFNVFGSLDYRKQDVIEAAQRDFAKTGIFNGAVTAGTSGTSFPGDLDGFEPSLPNCNPPRSIPNPAGTSCRYDFTGDIDIVPKNEQITGLLRGSFQVAPDHVLAGEYLRAQNKVVTRVAPAPTSDLFPLSHPNWPIDPATNQPRPTTQTDVDPNTPGDQPGGIVNWRQVPAGKRTSESKAVTERYLLELQGASAGWDYRGALGKNKNKTEDFVTHGYPNDDMIQNALLAGLINPFGPQSPADQAAIDAAQTNAKTVTATGDVDFVDARVTRDLAMLPAGPLSAALGAEYRREKFTWVAEDITAQLGSLGVDPDSDVTGKRNVSALFLELGIPIVKGLDATLAARYDKYSDFGSTFNPKVALRYQPVRQLLLRTSYNTGFRAPTLYDIYSPQSLTFTSDNYNDPLLCPGGVAVPGASAGVVCDQQVLRRLGGPVATGRPVDAVQPEKSKTATFGIVVEPVRELSVGLDFWWIRLRNQILQLPEQAIFGDPVKYANKFVRCSQIPATGGSIARDAIDACLNYPTFDPIAFIDAPTENLGNVNSNGIDLSLAARFPTGSFGRIGVSLEGTYVSKYEYQREKGGEYIQNAGVYADSSPVFRWQHLLSVNWGIGPWSVVVANLFKSGYTDQTPDREVGSYSIYDLSLTWTGVKDLSITAGVKNILDTDPPATNQVTTFQRGYDPRFTDPRGRTYMVRLGYKFL